MLARAYLEDHQLAAALHRAGPGPLLATLLARATRSVTALAAGIGGVMLYALASSFALLAVAKPVAPAHVGYWTNAGGSWFGLLGAPPPASAEGVGWWVVPRALAGALCCCLLAAGLMRWCGRRLLRRDRPPLG